MAPCALAPFGHRRTNPFLVGEENVVYMRCNAPSPPEKVLDFQGLFSFS